MSRQTKVHEPVKLKQKRAVQCHSQFRTWWTGRNRKTRNSNLIGKGQSAILKACRTYIPCSGVKKFLKNHELYHHRDFCVLGFCSKFQTTVFVICPGFDCLAKIVFGNLTALCSVSQTRIDRWTKFERRNLKNSWYPNTVNVKIGDVNFD